MVLPTHGRCSALRACAPPSRPDACSARCARLRARGRDRSRQLGRGAETATIINSGTADLDLSGWVLVSVRGDQRYSIPDGTMIPAGGSLVIASGDASGDLIWTTENMWNNEGDPAQLLDADGVVAAEG